MQHVFDPDRRRAWVESPYLRSLIVSNNGPIALCVVRCQTKECRVRVMIEHIVNVAQIAMLEMYTVAGWELYDRIFALHYYICSILTDPGRRSSRYDS
jgi:hypothetical protein